MIASNVLLQPVRNAVFKNISTEVHAYGVQTLGMDVTIVLRADVLLAIDLTMEKGHIFQEEVVHLVSQNLEKGAKIALQAVAVLADQDINFQVAVV